MSAPHPKANFNNFNGAAFQKIKDLRSKAFPVRVIDLKETIESNGGVVFQKPKSWHFHTISHRWSDCIEKLSAQVSRNLEGLGMGMGIGSVYDEAFKHSNFKGDIGYKCLIDYFKILREDGVELVWFDTLCINQSDQTEKANEILHMGEFYSLSLGCYVALHGFGHGFGALDKNHLVPAWFTRAWTLQEFLLPKRLTFVVEMQQPQFHNLVKFVKDSHLDGKCACRRKVNCSNSTAWAWGKAKRNASSSPKKDSVTDADEREFWGSLKCSEYRCTRGRLVRAGGEATQSHFYFVDRNAYVPLASIILPADQDNNQIWDLGIRLGLACQGETVGLVREISDRNCKMEEDRALCMLALLGVSGDGRMQIVRKNATLDKQLIELAKAMARCNVEDLIKLAVGAVMPSPTAGMSWMPKFTKQPRYDHTIMWVLSHMVALDRECVANMKEFQNKVESVSVSDEGYLTLKCPFMSARLHSTQEHATNCTHVTNPKNGKGCASCCCLNSCHENCFLANDSHSQEWVLEMSQGHALPFHSSLILNHNTASDRAFWPHLMGTGNSNYVESNYYFRGGLVLPNHHIANISKLSLLLMGVSMERRQYWPLQMVLLFMVCSGESPNKLHKIGQIRVLPSYDKMKVRSIIELDNLPKAQCTVG